MIVYWILLAVTYICYLLVYRNKKETNKKRKRFLILSSIPMILVMGLRDANVGVDTISYTRNFSIICNLKWSDFGVNDYSHGNAGHYELGYYYLNKIVSVFTEEPQMLLMITAIIIVACMCYAIYLLSENVLMSVSMFQTFGFYCYGIALIRQFLAVPIVLISFYYFTNKDYKKTFLLVIIASLFHSSALIFIVVYLFLMIVNKRLLKLRFVIALAVCALIPIAYQIVITVVPRYRFYLTYQAQEYTSSGLFALFVVSMLLLPACFKKKRFYKDEVTTYLIQLLTIAAAINLMASGIAMLGRIVFMFTIFILVYIPRMLKALEYKKNRKLVRTMVYAIQMLYYFNFLYYSTAHVCPYRFFWQ